jgi:hypothetical protein
MNEHVTQWLEAYYDGELKGRRAQHIEAHVASCESCRKELEDIQMLSALLTSAPAASNLTSPETFVAQVGLRLPRQPEARTWQRVYRTGWRLAPFGILATWAFLQASIFVTGLFNLGLQIIPGGDQIAGVLSSQSGLTLAEGLTSSNLSLFNLGKFGLDFLWDGSILGWLPTLSLGLTILVGMLYLSWLASWWVRESNNKNHQSIHENRMERSKS